MLAALPDRRHAGVGFALKLAQRASCLDRDIHLVRWTFDPLVARNAHLNINKLGATCDRFHRDYYGQMPDAINAGDRSDRLVVRWRLDREPGAPRAPGDAECSSAAAVRPTPRRPTSTRRARRRRGARRRGRRGADPGRSRRPARRRPRRSAPRGARPTGAALEACFAAGPRGRRVRPRSRRRQAHLLPRSGGHGVSTVRAIELRLIGLAAGSSVPHELRHLDREGLRARAARDRRRRGVGRVRRRRRARATARSSTRARGSCCAIISRRRCCAPATSTIDDLDRVLAHVRGNPMAKAALIDAFVDADAARSRRVAGLVARRRSRPGGLRGVDRHRRHDRGAARAGRRLPGRGLPPHQAQDRARPRRRAGRRGARRAPRHRAQRRRQRRVHDRRRRRVPRARRVTSS